ncbi:cytochrome P450 6B6-like [Ostrinia furnacalis]|uniref:cytochrome P450 6B6-like n=1 Tax=Ostrinia furnacalis TaxID=93504 RepID=UPI00103FF6B1|nr:cytochrome P450 6B6-like [Ostrinia furnacalis]
MIVVALVAIALVALYFYNVRNFNYWKERGVKHEKPILLFGTNAKNYLQKQSVTENLMELYWKYPDEKVVGFYRSTDPCLLVKDPEIIKRVLQTDFSMFYPRGLNRVKGHEIEPMLRNLFFADGDTWRLLRQRMTPAFTSGKLRAMFPLIVERAESLQARALAAAAAGRTLDARDLMARYTTDFIGACGFGLEADSLNEDDSAFRKLGAKIFRFSVKDAIIIMLKDFFPHLLKRVHTLKRVEGEMTDLVRVILKQRNYQPSGRNDFIDLLLECKKKGTLVGESIEKRKADGTPETATLELDDVLMTAQVFVFFAAGFETSSSATSFTLHQLAYHPEVQKKVQEDIDRVLAKHDNKLSYEAVKEMTYLDWAFKEGMRMFPSLGFLVRKCVGKYTIPEIGLTIDEKARIWIPVQSLHMDPKYFDNPEEFRPERFHPDSYDSANLKYVYLPFGEGPRACIGERLGHMQSLAGLAAILSRFTVEPAPETVRKPAVSPNAGIVQSIQGGIPLLFKERKINKL